MTDPLVDLIREALGESLSLGHVITRAALDNASADIADALIPALAGAADIVALVRQRVTAERSAAQ